jgi:hypothetical protein
VCIRIYRNLLCVYDNNPGMRQMYDFPFSDSEELPTTLPGPTTIWDRDLCIYFTHTLPTATPTMVVTPTPPILAGFNEDVFTYPSPAKGSEVRFCCQADNNAKIKIEIYNIMGEKVDTIDAEQTTAGPIIIPWNISKTAPGIYFYRLSITTTTSKKQLSLKKLVITK